MFTKKALGKYINSFLEELIIQGYSPNKVVLFGSYANGKPKAQSDIDLAVWDKHFTGCTTKDIEPILKIVSKYPFIELHTFSENETTSENPFLSVIEKTGIPINYHNP